MAPRPANASIEAVGPPESAATTLGEFRLPPSCSAAIERCWRKASVPAEWKLAREQFIAALKRSVVRRFAGASTSENAIEAYLESLHAADLALACACSAGSPAAWDFFVAQFRPELYRAARALAGDANARELADSLYADLYGLRETDGRRKSLFDYFHGRSKLTTWLRAVLAQRHVDEIRRARKTESLEDGTGSERHEIAGLEVRANADAGTSLDAERAKYLAILQAALSSALASLAPRDRLRLAYYYVDGRTLAQIGCLLREHEATVSRKLDRTRRDVRHRVEVVLREEKKWGDAQVRACLEYARGEWPFDLEKALRSEVSSFEPAAEAGAASAPD